MKRTTPDVMLIKEEICTDKTDIDDAFNDYFATNCSNNHVQSNDTPSYENYLNTPTVTSFNFQPIGNTVTVGCQLSRIWRDSHAFDLLLT